MHSQHSIPLPHSEQPLVLGPKALVMGILNVTPDSFSDGGTHNLVEAAVAHARRLIDEGAAIIDIGGESTRPGATPVPVQDELDRVIPVIDALRSAGITIPISIDTYKPLVADQALQAGANIINDVHGLQRFPEMAEVAVQHDAPVVVMHWQPDRDPTRPLLDDMADYFATTVTIAASAGLAADRLILDPGIGFAKSLAENYEALRNLRFLRSDDVRIHASAPILVGTSRKSLIGKLLGNTAQERLAGTIATNVIGYMNGGHIFRVHDVRAHSDALRVAQATLYGPPEHLE
jgi:dihydropteroate synthase